MGIQTHDHCDTGAVLYKLSYQTNWELVTLWVTHMLLLCQFKFQIKWLFLMSANELVRVQK